MSKRKKSKEFNFDKERSPQPEQTSKASLKNFGVSRPGRDTQKVAKPADLWDLSGDDAPATDTSEATSPDSEPTPFETSDSQATQTNIGEEAVHTGSSSPSSDVVQTSAASEQQSESGSSTIDWNQAPESEERPRTNEMAAPKSKKKGKRQSVLQQVSGQALPSPKQPATDRPNIEFEEASRNNKTVMFEKPNFEALQADQAAANQVQEPAVEIAIPEGETTQAEVINPDAIPEPESQPKLTQWLPPPRRDTKTDALPVQQPISTQPAAENVSYWAAPIQSDSAKTLSPSSPASDMSVSLPSTTSSEFSTNEPSAKLPGLASTPPPSTGVSEPSPTVSEFSTNEPYTGLPEFTNMPPPSTGVSEPSPTVSEFSTDEPYTGLPEFTNMPPPPAEVSEFASPQPSTMASEFSSPPQSYAVSEFASTPPSPSAVPGYSYPPQPASEVSFGAPPPSVVSTFRNEPPAQSEFTNNDSASKPHRRTIVQEFDISKLVKETERKTQEVKKLELEPEPQFDSAMHFFTAAAERMTYTAELRFRASYTPAERKEVVSEPPPEASWHQTGDETASGSNNTFGFKFLNDFVPPRQDLPVSTSSKGFNMLDLIDEGYRTVQPNPTFSQTRGAGKVEVAVDWVNSGGRLPPSSRDGLAGGFGGATKAPANQYKKNWLKK